MKEELKKYIAYYYKRAYFGLTQQEEDRLVFADNKGRKSECIFTSFSNEIVLCRMTEKITNRPERVSFEFYEKKEEWIHKVRISIKENKMDSYAFGYPFSEFFSLYHDSDYTRNFTEKDWDDLSKLAKFSVNYVTNLKKYRLAVVTGEITVAYTDKFETLLKK